MKTFAEIVGTLKGDKGNVELVVDAQSIKPVQDIYTLSFSAHTVDLNEYINSHRVFDTPALLVDSVNIQMLQDVDDATTKSIISFVEDVAPLLIRNLTPDDLGIGDVALLTPEKIAVDRVTLSDGLSFRLHRSMGNGLELAAAAAKGVTKELSIDVGIFEDNFVFVSDKGVSQRLVVDDGTGIEVAKGPFSDDAQLTEDFLAFPELRPRDYIQLQVADVREVEKVSAMTLACHHSLAREIARDAGNSMVNVSNKTEAAIDRPCLDDMAIASSLTALLGRNVIVAASLANSIHVPWAHYGKRTALDLEESIGRVITSWKSSYLPFDHALFIRKKLQRLWYSNVVIGNMQASEIDKPVKGEINIDSALKNVIYHYERDHLYVGVDSFDAKALKSFPQGDWDDSPMSDGIALLEDLIEISRMRPIYPQSDVDIKNASRKEYGKPFPDGEISFGEIDSRYTEKPLFLLLPEFTHTFGGYAQKGLSEYAGFEHEFQTILIASRLLSDNLYYRNEAATMSCKRHQDVLDVGSSASLLTIRPVSSLLGTKHTIDLDRYTCLGDAFGFADEIEINGIKQKMLASSFGYKNQTVEYTHKGAHDAVGIDSSAALLASRPVDSLLLSGHTIDLDRFMCLGDAISLDSEVTIQGIKQNMLACSFGYSNQTTAYPQKGTTSKVVAADATAVEGRKDLGSVTALREDVETDVSCIFNNDFLFGHIVNLYKMRPQSLHDSIAHTHRVSAGGSRKGVRSWIDAKHKVSTSWQGVCLSPLEYHTATEKAFSTNTFGEFRFFQNVDIYSLRRWNHEDLLSVGVTETRRDCMVGARNLVDVRADVGLIPSKQLSAEFGFSSTLRGDKHKGINTSVSFLHTPVISRIKSYSIESAGPSFSSDIEKSPIKGAVSVLDNLDYAAASSRIQSSGAFEFGYGLNNEYHIGVDDSTEVVLSTGDGRQYIMNPETMECFLDYGDMARAHPTWRPCVGKSTWNQQVSFYKRSIRVLEELLEFDNAAAQSVQTSFDEDTIHDSSLISIFDGRNNTVPTPYDTAFGFNEYGASASLKVFDETLPFAHRTHIVAIKPKRIFDGFELHVSEPGFFRDLAFDNIVRLEDVYDIYQKFTGHYEYDHVFSDDLSLTMTEALCRTRFKDCESTISSSDELRTLFGRSIDEVLEQAHRVVSEVDVGIDTIPAFNSELQFMLDAAKSDDDFVLRDEALFKLARVYRMVEELQATDGITREIEAHLVPALHFATATAIAGGYELNEESHFEHRFFSNFRYFAEALAIGDETELADTHTPHQELLGLQEQMDSLRIIAPSYTDSVAMRSSYCSKFFGSIDDEVNSKQGISYKLVSHTGFQEPLVSQHTLEFSRFMSTEERLGFVSDIDFRTIKHLIIDDELLTLCSVDSALNGASDENRGRLFNQYLFNVTTYN